MKAIGQEIQLAGEMLSDAYALYKQERLKSGVNRAYYAMFHATKAILLSCGTDSQSHAGALNRFGEYVIKKEIMDKKFAKSLHRAYRLREKSDYSPVFKIGQIELCELIKETEEFIGEVKRVLKEKGVI